MNRFAGETGELVRLPRRSLIASDRCSGSARSALPNGSSGPVPPIDTLTLVLEEYFTQPVFPFGHEINLSFQWTGSIDPLFWWFQINAEPFAVGVAGGARLIGTATGSTAIISYQIVGSSSFASLVPVTPYSNIILTADYPFPYPP